MADVMNLSDAGAGLNRIELDNFELNRLTIAIAAAIVAMRKHYDDGVQLWAEQYVGYDNERYAIDAIEDLFNDITGA